MSHPLETSNWSYPTFSGNGCELEWLFKVNACFLDWSQKAFDSIHHETLGNWRCSATWEITKVAGLLTGLCCGTQKLWYRVEGRRFWFLPCDHRSRKGLHLCSNNIQHISCLVVGRVVNQSHCATSFDKARLPTLFFVDDTVILGDYGTFTSNTKVINLVFCMFM